ncbi:response regulator transcription factor [Rhizobium leguminosarum]
MSVIDGITPREVEIIHWMAAGKTSSETAEILAITEHTVNTYIERIKPKLGAFNRASMIAAAFRTGLIQ